MDPGQAIDYLVGKTQIETLIGLDSDSTGPAFRFALPRPAAVVRNRALLDDRVRVVGDTPGCARGLEPLAPRRVSMTPFAEITSGSLGSRKLPSPKGYARSADARAREGVALFDPRCARRRCARARLVRRHGGDRFRSGVSRSVASRCRRIAPRNRARDRGGGSATSAWIKSSRSSPLPRNVRSIVWRGRSYRYRDPPYADQVPLQVFRLLRERNLLSPEALVVYEHAAKQILPDIPGYRSAREEVYGDVALAFLAP